MVFLLSSLLLSLIADVSAEAKLLLMILLLVSTAPRFWLADSSLCSLLLTPSFLKRRSRICDEEKQVNNKFVGNVKRKFSLKKK